MVAKGNDNDTEQNIPMDPANLEEEGNIATSLLSVLSAMQESLTSSNSMLRDLVEKKRKSTETDSISKEESVMQANHVVLSMLQRKHLRLLQKK